MAIQTPASTAAAVAPIHRVEELSREDIPFAGGKGANLGELTKAGFPVPSGFVVGAPAYAEFCDEGGLRARLAERLAGVHVDDTAALESAAADTRAMVEHEPVPTWLEAAIRAAVAQLAAGEAIAVAVRSSATSEDTASASFAGMNETFLNVRGADRSSPPCGAAGRRCSVRAPSSTAPSAASGRPTWTSPWSCSARCRRRGPA